MNIKLPIVGMHCASCAAKIEDALKKAEGVSSASVNFATEHANIEFDESPATVIAESNAKVVQTESVARSGSCGSCGSAGRSCCGG